jgi:hypothetical protein
VIDYDMLILVVSWAYKDHAQFHHLLYSFQTHVRKAQNMVTRCASYRHYVMNKWEKEMTEVDKKKVSARIQESDQSYVEVVKWSPRSNDLWGRSHQ